MLFRTTTEADLGNLLDCVVEEPVSWADPDRLTAFLKDGNYTHDRIWIAEDEGKILARAVWWGFPVGGPLALDCVYVDASVTDRVTLAADLLAAAHEAFGTKPEYHVFLPSGWRDDPAVVAAVGWRREALARNGLDGTLERLRFEWTGGVPAASDRLVFSQEPDDEVFAQAFQRVAVGTLDAHTRAELAVKDAAAQARDDVAGYRSLPGDRSWWRLAHTPDGDLVGLAIASANAGGPTVGYLGVVPEHRGRGYVADLLNEITRSHAERGATRIVADTDTGNVPMAAAFERAGYRVFAVRLVTSES
ncbi:MAG: GNAT family N-acetyltransferase [Nonomuraea sp.]|nr:GNAT family N-acetyltransferase [Nonomuraea sp.]